MLILREKCAFKNNIIKYIPDLEGRFRLYIFQASEIPEHRPPRKPVHVYRSPDFQETKALCIAESDLNNSAPTTSRVNCFTEVLISRRPKYYV
jgi:hypothetical protein